MHQWQPLWFNLHVAHGDRAGQYVSLAYEAGHAQDTTINTSSNADAVQWLSGTLKWKCYSFAGRKGFARAKCWASHQFAFVGGHSKIRHTVHDKLCIFHRFSGHTYTGIATAWGSGQWLWDKKPCLWNGWSTICSMTLHVPLLYPESNIALTSCLIRLAWASSYADYQMRREAVDRRRMVQT